MRLSPLFAVVTLAACATATDSADGGDTADDPNAVPADYADVWDTEAVSCPDGALGYWAFEGEIDGDRLSGVEKWYWFFPDDTVDCVDTFSLEGDAEDTPVSDDPCYSCDRDFTAEYKLTGKTCSWAGYESLLDGNDEEDSAEDETYEMALMFDLDRYDPPEADVWSFVRDPEDRRSWMDRETVKGEWAGADKDADGHIRWANEGMCIEIKEE